MMPKPASLDLMPPPFAWCNVTGGTVTLRQKDELFYAAHPGGNVTVTDFAISKYPITNPQYALFMQARGYQQRRWWTEAGWDAVYAYGWWMPRYWTDGEWLEADCPVTGISWYEAVAYCRWLSETTGENIILPTEAQWQRAAQGDDERLYPWGNEWDATRCNNIVRPLRTDDYVHRTTPVTFFEGKGDSPFGVVDMVGNLAEWCLTAFGTGSNDPEGDAERILRGGAFIDHQPYDFEVTDGYPNHPDRWTYRGFRIARLP